MPEVKVKGVEIHFLEKKGSGTPPIIFIPGGGGNASVWKKVMDELEGFRLIAVDLPGHGDSKGKGEKIIRKYTEFINEFCSGLGFEEIVLGGHSMGGCIALDFAIRYPRKTKALLLIGTGARLKVLPGALENLKRMAEGEIPPRFDPWAFSRNATQEVIAEGEKEWSMTSPKVRYLDMLACDQFDVIGDLGQVKCPALVACGREDQLTPIKYSEFLTNKITGSRMEIIENSAHMSMIENPRALGSAIVNFLKSLS